MMSPGIPDEIGRESGVLSHRRLFGIYELALFVGKDPRR